MKFISVIKAEFSASLLQSLVSHDPSEIILIYTAKACPKVEETPNYSQEDY